MVRFNADTVPWYSERVHLGDGRSVVGRGGREKKKMRTGEGWMRGEEGER